MTTVQHTSSANNTYVISDGLTADQQAEVERLIRLSEMRGGNMNRLDGLLDDALGADSLYSLGELGGDTDKMAQTLKNLSNFVARYDQFMAELDQLKAVDPVAYQSVIDRLEGMDFPTEDEVAAYRQSFQDISATLYSWDKSLLAQTQADIMTYYSYTPDQYESVFGPTVSTIEETEAKAKAELEASWPSDPFLRAAFIIMALAQKQQETVNEFADYMQTQSDKLDTLNAELKALVEQYSATDDDDTRSNLSQQITAKQTEISTLGTTNSQQMTRLQAEIDKVSTANQVATNLIDDKAQNDRAVSTNI